MSTEYNKNMKLVYYESRELEIVERVDNHFHFYFKNIYELLDLIKTSPEASRKIFLELLEEFGDDCPRYDDCVNSEMENMEPMRDEGRD